MPNPRRILDVLGLRRSIAGILIMAVLVGMGERMAERFLPLYLVSLGSGILWPGFLNAINILIGALYSFPGGWLAEKVGARRALLIFNLMTIAGFALVVAVPRWQAVVAGSFLFLSWSAISLPGTLGLVAKALPKQQHVMGVAMHSLTRRLPMAIGPLVGGILIDRYGAVDGVRAAFSLAIALAAIAAVAQQQLIEETPSSQQTGTTNNPLRLFGAFPKALRSLLLSDIMIRFCEQIPYAYVVLWCIEPAAGYRTARISATRFGVLTCMEMATAVVCYLPVARFADRGNKKPFVVVTFINFALFPLVLFFSRSFPMLAIAFMVRGLKEFGEPTRKALIMHLAPENRKAASFGVYYLCRDTIVSLSALAGAFLWRASPAANLFIASAFGIAGAIWFAAFGRED